jgi:hypothetical protein
MGFYELRSATELPHFVKRPSKVVGGERASTAHPWDLWGVGRIFAYDKANEEIECHGQRSELVHSKMYLEEYVKKMFFEEHTAHQMEEIWKLNKMELEFFGMVGLEEWSLLCPVFNSNQEVGRLLQRKARRR